MLEIGAFSNLLLELEALAQESAIDEFQTSVLSAVQKIMPFDKAWWGIMSPSGSGFSLHSSHLFELPTSYVDVWEEVKSEDLVAKAVAVKENETVYFDQRRLLDAPGLATLTGDHGIGQAFCTSVKIPTQTSFMFLSLYRSFGESDFSGTDRLLVQYLVRHLFILWTTNRNYQMQRLKSAASPGQYSMAIADRQMQVLNAEPDFERTMRLEWPEWAGGPVPRGVCAAFTRNRGPDVKLDQIVMRRYQLGEFSLLLVRQRSAADSLSPRELDIAGQFGSGNSYKEIARQSGISPATVRHHLRAIYGKLGVTDKGEMSSAVRGQEDPLSQDELIHRYRRLQGPAAGRLSALDHGTLA